ncbi:hypothetical protein HYFRA_00007852 [Hymenoscyphus fraxineus]|uniref:Uncharacterized protein n=1 Tax=Hymenoscyphus fraxineus TaxID=746836 RepID=A0A9N9KKY0_9HELO|nr:hypothetical protein HYFRA_00007852 [Hymenoscyphus fraxineus]
MNDNSQSDAAILAATANQTSDKYFVIHLRSTLQLPSTSVPTLSRASTESRQRIIEAIGKERVATYEAELKQWRSTLRKDYGIICSLVFKYLCKDVKISSLLARSNPRFPGLGVLVSPSQLLQLRQLPHKPQPLLPNNKGLDELSQQISHQLSMEDKPGEVEASKEVSAEPSANTTDSSTDTAIEASDTAIEAGLNFDNNSDLIENPKDTTTNEPLAFSGYYKINGKDVCDSSVQVSASDLPPSEDLDQFDMTPVVPWMEEHPKPGDVDEEAFVDYYKHLVAFVYCATGDERKETARACFPPNVIPSDDQFTKVYFVIEEIKEKIASAVGLPVLVNMLRETDLQQLAKEELFNSMNGRVKFFRTAFLNDPTALLQIVHEINPALNVEFIFTNNIYKGHLSYLTQRRSILRKHLCTKIALLMDLVFHGQINLAQDDDYGNNTEWVSTNVLFLSLLEKKLIGGQVKERITNRLKPHPATEKQFGEVKLNEWPIKSPIDPKNNQPPWETWFRAPRTEES